jgi:HK97 family phage portal protein
MSIVKKLARKLLNRHTKNASDFDLKSKLFGQKSFVYSISDPAWTGRNYAQFAREGYVKNVIVHRCINMIAAAASSVDIKLYNIENQAELDIHPLLDLLQKPSPFMSGVEFIENIVEYLLISGNVYVVKAYSSARQYPEELYLLRPDRVKIVATEKGLMSYEYKVGDKVRNFRVNKLSGKSDILHLKTFHPTDDRYGLSPVEAAAYSIDQHNQAAAWNQALLQNGARPSGALVVKPAPDGSGGLLTEEQYQRIKKQVEELYMGSVNAGRPMLLEGGLDWKEMSINPKDMDYVNVKYSAARDIALAFGVPPQLLGIPGDNTYSNLVEARLALWEQSVLPLLDKIIEGINNSISSVFDNSLRLSYDIDSISALSTKQDKVWARVKAADFMTINEKRAAVGLGAVAGGDELDQ